MAGCRAVWISQLQVYLSHLGELIEGDMGRSSNEEGLDACVFPHGSSSLTSLGGRRQLIQDVRELLYVLERFAGRPELSGEWLEFKVARLLDDFERIGLRAWPDGALLGAS